MCARPSLISPPEGVNVLNTYVRLSPCLHQLCARILLELVDNVLWKPAAEEQWPPRSQERLMAISTRRIHVAQALTNISSRKTCAMRFCRMVAASLPALHGDDWNQNCR